MSVTEETQTTQQLHDQLNEKVAVLQQAMNKRANELDLTFEAMFKAVLRNHLGNNEVDYMEWFPDDSFRVVETPEGYDLNSKSADEIKADCIKVKMGHVDQLIELAPTVDFDEVGGITLGSNEPALKYEDARQVTAPATEVSQSEPEEPSKPAGLGAALAKLAKRKENAEPTPEPTPEPAPTPEPVSYTHLRAHEPLR